jgi:thiamine pyrophosphate-dependent acetolactate synthase large subunit-like protein
MSRMNAGSAIVECLRTEDVRYAFGIIGSSYLEILDALHDPDDIEFVSVRHEQAAVHIADAYARARGGLGVCLAQGGPGVSNLVTGTALAKLACSPVLAIGGATMTSHDQRDSFQEIDQLNLMRTVCKDVMQIGRPDRAAEMTRHVIRKALSGRPGPTFLEVPRDILSTEVEFTPHAPSQYRSILPAGPDPTQVERAVNILMSAEKPLIVAGNGIKWGRATAEVLALAEALNAPIVASNGNKDILPADHPRCFGQLGPRGSSMAKELAQQADVIFALGTRLGFTTAFFNYDYVGKGARIIQCDIEGSEIGRLYPVELGIVGDARLVAAACIQEIAKQVARRTTAAWQDAANSARQKWQMARDAELRRAVPRDIHLTTDAGYWGNCSTDAFDHYECPSLFTPGEFGCLGFSFPAALGVKFAKPEAPVICVNGDGGFAMNLQELETAVRCKLNPVVLVLNNNSWGVEKSYQKDFFDKRYVGANLGNPRFDKVAEAFGARGAYVDKADQIGDVVREAFKSDLPTVIEVEADPEEIYGLRRDAVVARKS